MCSCCDWNLSCGSERELFVEEPCEPGALFQICGFGAKAPSVGLFCSKGVTSDRFIDPSSEFRLPGTNGDKSSALFNENIICG